MNTRDLQFRSNRVRDIIALFHEQLDTVYGAGEVGMFITMLFEAFLGWDKVRLMLGREATIDQSDLLRFHWALEDLKKQRPIQHIIGHTDFCGCRIEVNPDVLIPRPETEEMVDRILSTLPSPSQSFHCLDLCTGSGCIAIALKKSFPHAEVTAVDISDRALAIARRNAETNGVDVNFIQADLLDPALLFPNSAFQLIISNPPYVRESERSAMRPNVLDYDPALALFVPDDDPLRFYRAIAAIAARSLAPDGLLAVEINETLASETSTLLAAHNLSPTLHHDFRTRPRWLAATKK